MQSPKSLITAWLSATTKTITTHTCAHANTHPPKYQQWCVSKCTIDQIFKSWLSVCKQNTSNRLNDLLGDIPL